jgi:lipopolysaccharide transport system permease protein
MMFRIARLLGWQDVKQAYRRSAVGPFWITIGMAVQIITMGLVFGLIFKSNISEYIPFLASSIIFWGFISSTINEGCLAFVSAEAMIKQLRIGYYEYVVRVVWRNAISSLHNLIILPIVLIFFWKLPGLQILALVPGVLILILNVSWVVWLLGIVSARYRDMPPIVSSVTLIAFYVTPVMWYPSLIKDSQLAHLLLGLNPIYHWLQIVRLPILGQWPTWENWLLSVICACLGWALTILVHRKYRNMIAYWV